MISKKCFYDFKSFKVEGSGLFSYSNFQGFPSNSLPSGLLSFREFLAQTPPDPIFDISSRNSKTTHDFETPSVLRRWGSFQNEMDMIFENLLAQHGEVRKFTATSFWMRTISKESTLHSICLCNLLDPLSNALFDDVQIREGYGN